MSFGARAFLAAQLGCEPDELRLAKGPVQSYRGEFADYVRRGERVGSVLVGHVAGGGTGRARKRRVTADWPSGQTSKDIAQDEPIEW
jgi:hypothetical protein